MQQKIIEIIELLITEISEIQEPFLPDLDKISKKLLEKGYTERDIQEAVEWIVDFMDTDNVPVSPGNIAAKEKRNLRLLSNFEQRVFSNEAYGFLIQMQNLGLLSPMQLDQIIDRFLMIGMESVGLEDVKAVTVQMLLGKDLSISGNGKVFYPGNERIH